MPNYRRWRQAGGTWFFTVNLRDRRLRLLVEHIGALREATAWTMRRRPFRIDVFVVLPDHLHAIWTLPEDDTDFSTRWRLIKGRFSTAIPRTEESGSARLRAGERGVWQRRFWEHHIRDEEEYGVLVEYCLGNPVKHGHVQRVADWPYSSFHREVRRGNFARDWGGDDLPGAFGERDP